LELKDKKIKEFILIELQKYSNEIYLTMKCITINNDLEHLFYFLANDYG